MVYLNKFAFLASLSGPVVSSIISKPPIESGNIADVNYNNTNLENISFEEPQHKSLEQSSNEIKIKSQGKSIIKETTILTLQNSITNSTVNIDPEFVAQGNPRWHIGSGVYINKEVDYGDCDDSESDWSGSSSDSDSDSDGKKFWFLKVRDNDFNQVKVPVYPVQQ